MNTGTVAQDAYVGVGDHTKVREGKRERSQTFGMVFDASRRLVPVAGLRSKGEKEKPARGTCAWIENSNVMVPVEGVVPIQIPTSAPPQPGIFEPHTQPSWPEGYRSSLLCEIIARLVLSPCRHPVRNVTTNMATSFLWAPKSRTSASPVLALPSR